MSKPKRIITLVHADGRITTEHGWYIGKLADIVDYDGLEKEAQELGSRMEYLDAIDEYMGDREATAK